MKEPRIREIDARGYVKRLGAMLDVYTAAMDPPLEQLPGRRTIMERHATYPDFQAFVAERRRSVVGFVYGFHGEIGQWWHDVVYQALADLGSGQADVWLTNPFEVAELHVHPAYQGQGIGRRLLETICAGRPESTVVLSTLDRPGSRARRLYHSVGMTDLLSGFEFPGGGPRYAVMAAPLPLAAKASTPKSA
ncbi:MAG TPA: GNAT family N-acetyltransferase [Streptosporangiaceae bacterium]|nr:GNAT family N-acetyltransferase [Streptosporangiaceae bacterium]